MQKLLSSYGDCPINTLVDETIKEETTNIQPGSDRRKLYNVQVLCGDCNISKDYESRKEPIDLFNDFVDWFMKSGSI